MTAAAKPPATSIASITYALDGGSPVTTPGATCSVPFSVDAATHGNDGEHTLTYVSTDDRGTVAPDQTLTFNIDTRKPVTKALYPAATTRGGKATLKYKVYNVVNGLLSGGGTATVTIKIKDRANRVVKTLGPYKGKTIGTSYAVRFTCTLPKGAYRYFVYAKDAAGNTQDLPVGSNTLTVTLAA